MYNLKAYQVEQELVKIINSSDINLVTMKLIVDKLASELNSALLQQIQKESEELAQSQQVDIDMDVVEGLDEISNN